MSGTTIGSEAHVKTDHHKSYYRMKTFVERYSRDEFQLKADISRVFAITRSNSNSGNYRPFYIRAKESLAWLYLSDTIFGKGVSVNLFIGNVKLDFVTQVWEKAQELTKHKYPDYLEHQWRKTDDPIKELIFTSKYREEAGKYFGQLLAELCHDPAISASERTELTWKKPLSSETEERRIDVWLNEEIITSEISDKLYRQFCGGDSHFDFAVQNKRFSFEEIKDYFVYCDSRFLALLNAVDGMKTIADNERWLFDAAEKLDFKGILNALDAGANINAIDLNGETAFTKVFQYFHDRIYHDKDLDKKAFTRRAISIAGKLLKLGADINFFGYGGVNALQYTAYAQNPIMMKFLLDNGANPNINYFPEDGHEFIVSDPLYSILGEYDLYKDAENLKKCESLLVNAGAKYHLEE